MEQLYEYEDVDRALSYYQHLLRESDMLTHQVHDVPALLSRYNYLELRKLCQTDKYFVHVCNDNSLLRQIIAYRNPLFVKLNIPLDFDIAGALDELFKFIDECIKQRYQPFPEWVNGPLFVKEMRKVYYRWICTMLIENDVIHLKSKILYQNVVYGGTIPLNASNIQLDDDELDDDDEIKVPKLLQEYVRFINNLEFDKKRFKQQIKIRNKLFYDMLLYTK